MDKDIKDTPPSKIKFKKDFRRAILLTIVLIILIIFSAFLLVLDKARLFRFLPLIFDLKYLEYLEFAFLFLTLIFSSLLFKEYFYLRKINQDFQESEGSFLGEEEKALLSQLGEATFIVDPEERIILFNKKAEAITGFKEKELLAEKYFKVLSFRDENGTGIGESNSPIKKSWNIGGALFSNNLKLKTKEGRLLEISSSFAPLKDKSGQITGAICLFRNVTGEREGERKKREFISLAIHELNTPVATICGNLSMILDEGIGQIDEQARPLLEGAFKGGKRLSKLIKSLLTVSRLAQRSEMFQLKPISLIPLIEEVIADLSVLAEEKKLSLSFEQPQRSLPLVLADPDAIKEVLMNLVDNAIKFTKEGKVTIRTAEGKEVVIVCVEDTGIGIPEGKFPYLFRKFSQLEGGEVRESQGVGLGLYIIKSILDLHSGKIWLESKLGEGSKFSFSLPKAELNR